MKKKFTRRDFLKMAGMGTAVIVPGVLGYGLYRSALGEQPLETSPYVENLLTTSLDGSVPILLIINQDSSNPFGIYLAEILRAEGINCFHTTDLSSLRSDELEKYDMVILAETPLSGIQTEMFESFVWRGGNLVGMKPDNRLELIFGVERSNGYISEGYLKTESNHPISEGINSSTLQYHGEANNYLLAGGQAVAWLYTDRDTASKYPAIIINSHGKGNVAAWAFDLAKSIAYTRQGNPEFSNQERDDYPYIRATDMFVDWIDLERIGIPQADEHQRLFIKVLHELSRNKRPLPRLWYFPQDKKGVLIVTGDAHMNPANYIEETLEHVEVYGGHMTVYYAPQLVDDYGRMLRKSRYWLEDQLSTEQTLWKEGSGSPTPLMVEIWRARGHEIALHPYVDEGLEDGWLNYWKEFTGRGYGPVSPTVRTHRILWTGWVETARVQASYGMRMNFDYYHVGPSFQKNGKWMHGHFTGSGRPMKFIDAQGQIINVYQQLTQIADEHLLAMDAPTWTSWAQLTVQEAVEVSRYLLDRSIKHGEYCAIGGQFHIDPFQFGGDLAEKGRLFLTGVLNHAQQMDIPIISAQQWLQFTELRHDSNFTEMVWEPDASTLTFNLIPTGQSGSTLTILFPSSHNGRNMTAARVDNVTTPINTRLILSGEEYVQVAVSAQKHTIKMIYS